MRAETYRRLNAFIKYCPAKLKNRIYRRFGMKIGDNSRIGMGLLLDDPRNISIGNNCTITACVGMYTGVSDVKIEIGDNVWVGMEAKFVCPTHEIGSAEQRAGTAIYKPIKVGTGCWIGANATILPGVTIGEGCIIAAGAVVAADCEPNCIYGGVPAKIIRRLE